MAGPYRDSTRASAAEASRDPGIVGDVVAQFADPLAFFRELVQNAIDAGTPAVEVRIEHDAGAGLLRASVRDRGEGMTREIIEQQLLVVFRSTKERDETKIGKFGIGFARCSRRARGSSWCRRRAPGGASRCTCTQI